MSSGWLETFIESYGTAAVFLGTAVEGEGAAILGGAMAHRGHLPFWPIVLAAAAGGYLADLVIYALGRRYRGGRRVRKVLEHDKVARVIERLSRNLLLFALVFRFIPGMRTAGPLSLAAAGMRPLPYAACTGVAALCWGCLGVTFGYYLGHAVEHFFGEIERIEHAMIGPAIAALLIGTSIYLWRRNGRRTVPAPDLHRE
jgi:membrane protein DedA with SNARE-associated domain